MQEEIVQHILNNIIRTTELYYTVMVGEFEDEYKVCVFDSQSKKEFLRTHISEQSEAIRNEPKDFFNLSYFNLQEFGDVRKFFDFSTFYSDGDLIEIDLIEESLSNNETSLDVSIIYNKRFVKFTSIITNMVANVMFLEYLKSKLKTSDNSQQRLSLTKIALIHVYEGNHITRENGSQIASEYGFNSKNSGEKLYQNFTKYFSLSDRRGDEGTKLKNKNKLKLIESVLDNLTKGIDRAKSDIQAVESLISETYD